MRTTAIAAAALLLAACSPPGVSTGQGSNDHLTTQVGEGTSPYVVLDLQTREIAYRSHVADLAGDPSYRDRKMVFKRVGTGSAQVLVGVFAVTQAQWGRLDGSTPWTAVPGTVVSAAAAPDMPAYNLDYDSIAPALAAFAITGARLAVPTAAQYETAVGGGNGWAWGNAADAATLARYALVRETAVTAANSGTRLDATGNDIGGPEPVGQRQPSNGLYDLHGNVWQWTAPGTEVRGGSWYDPASLARAEVRAGVDQGLGSDVPHALIGVRLILVLQ